MTTLDAHIAAQFAHLQSESDLRAMSQSVSEMARELGDKKAMLDEGTSLPPSESPGTDAVDAVSQRLSALWAEAKELLAVAKTGMDAAEGVTKAAVDEASKGQLNLDLLEAQKAEKLAALATSSQISPEIMKQYEKRKTEVSPLFASSSASIADGSVASLDRSAQSQARGRHEQVDQVFCYDQEGPGEPPSLPFDEL